MPRYNFPVIKFEPFASSVDESYLDELNETLIGRGIDPTQIVYRGFNGAFAKQRRALPHEAVVFVMNGVGWRDNIAVGDTAAAYAEDNDVPAIGIYQADQLRLVYSTVDESDMQEPSLTLDSVITGPALADLGPTEEVFGSVAHLEQGRSVNTALAALVLPQY